MLRVSSIRLVASRTVARRSVAVRPKSTSSSSSSTSSPSGAPSGTGRKLDTTADREAYLKEANSQMLKYHDTRELMKQGKLASKNAHRGPQNAAGSQMVVVGLFLAAFLSMPFLGKKIARDEEFRKKWIPSFYDYTVPKPENPWTREELHEQMLQVQRDIRERAIRGEFTTEKLQEMQGSLDSLDYPHRAGIDKSKIPAGWDKIHPGLDDDESVNEA